jgi:hypothetical protein
MAGILQDLKISQIGQSSGRSGKSLITQAATLTRPSFYIGGKRRDITEKTEFIYDGFTRFHNIIEVDDLYEFADFNFFYTQVSGKREVNSKQYQQADPGLPRIGQDGDQQQLRAAEHGQQHHGQDPELRRVGLLHEKTKYNNYKETRSPLLKFGKELFTEFTEEEWVKFYNFMAYCIQLQMRFFKIQPPMDNLVKRQLRRLMTRGLSKDEEFFNWANNYLWSHPTPPGNQP